MADAKTAFDETVEGTTRMAKNLEASRKSAEGLGGLFSHLTQALLSARLMETAVHKILQHTMQYQRFVIATSVDNLNASLLTRREIDLMSKKNFLEERLNHLTGLRRKRAEEMLDVTIKELEATSLHLNLAKEIEKFGKARLTFLTILVGAAQDLWMKTRAFNQNLIEANASFEHRDRLMRETLATSAQLGVSFADATKSAAALVHYGLDMADTFDVNLRLVTQMESGLGANVHEAAKLASIVERQLKGSFESVSHIVAQLVDNTSLAADEAIRLGQNIATALGRLRPGLSAAGFPEVLRLVGRYESALKEVGGAAGGFQQLVSQLTTPEGIAGAGALNVSPEFLSTSNGVKTVMDRFAQYGEMLVGQSQGWERQFRLQALAQIFNISADSANQMLIAIKNVNNEQMTEISLQERWRNQLHATNAGLARLGNTLLALLNGALYPVVFAVGAVANKLADLVEWALQAKEVAYAISGALFVGFVATVAGLGGVVRGLWAVVFGSRAAEAALLRYSAAAAAGSAGSGISLLLRPLMLIVRAVGFLATSIWGLPLLALGAGLYALWKIQKDSLDQAKAAEKLIIARSDMLDQKLASKVYQNVRYDGTVEQVMADINRRFNNIVQEPVSPEEKRALIRKAAESAIADISMGVTTKRMAGPLMRELTPAERKREEDMLGLTGKIYQKASEQAKLAVKQVDTDETYLKEVEEEWSKNRLLNTIYMFMPKESPFKFTMPHW